MAPVRKRSRSSDLPTDRISSLPDSIISHILSFLPAEIFVRTNVLSKRWKLVWTKVPTLCFYQDNEKCNKRRMAFSNFVYKVFLHNNVEYLQKFELQWTPSRPFSGCPVLHSLKISGHSNKDIPVYKDVVDNDSDGVNESKIDKCNSATQLIQPFNSARLLSLGESLLTGLSRATTPLSACFDRLIELDVACKCCQWSFLSAMLECSVQLEVLEVSINTCDEETHKECWSDPKEVPRCLLSTLRYFSFTRLDGLKDRMEMIEYNLKHGAMLKRIELVSNASYCEFETKFKMLEKISMFPRASTCTIKFH